MPIDTSIYNQLLRPPKSVAEYDAEATQGQTNKLALAMNQAKMGEYQRGVQQENALADAYKGAVGADGAIDRTKLYTGLAQSGLGAKLPTVQKGFADQDKALLESHKTKLETGLKQYEAMAQVMSGVKDQASYDQAKQQAAQIMGPEAAASIPPVYDPAAVEAGRLKAMGVKDQMEFHYKEISSKLDADKFGETVRNNKDQTATTQRGQNMTANTAAAGRAQADRHFNATPKGQVTQTDAGTMLVDPRTGQATPVTLAGQPLGAKLKEIPASVNTAIIANSQSLSQLDKTIALLEGKSISGQVGDSAATGIKGYLPQQMLNAIDPQGIDARAGVADIGSLKLHDRSGAAVTASESPRLMPFIPLATDSNATALKKLKRLKQEVEGESAAMGDTYSKEQGYRPNPVLARNAAPPAGKPSLSDIFGK